uniref:ORF in intron n=1 Tax=Pleodorina californica TaxID=47285 RepID=O62966_9CHLO|nr:unnamed protein product [Pleodorina californica]
MNCPYVVNYYFNAVNSVSTLLNGKSLRKSIVISSLGKKQAYSGLPDPDNNPRNGKKKIAPNNKKKGLNSLDNPMLRGSFSLVLTEKKMDFFDSVAKQAFMEIISHELFSVTPISEPLNTIHLTTDPGRLQNGRPGVYIIKHVEDGMCIVGQTKNLKRRFNQYTSRGTTVSPEGMNRINKNFYAAVQQAINKGLAYSQVFQRYVVYTWVDQDKKPLDIHNSLVLRNEISYLEHRLILAFFECGLCYNLNDTFPQLSHAVSLPPIPVIADTTDVSVQKSQLIAGPHKSKPFKIGGLYFYSKKNYIAFRDYLNEVERKKFLAVSSLRQKLEKNVGNLSADIRYLTPKEVLDCKKNNLFIKLDRLKKTEKAEKN